MDYFIRRLHMTLNVLMGNQSLTLTRGILRTQFKKDM